MIIEKDTTKIMELKSLDELENCKDQLIEVEGIPFDHVREPELDSNYSFTLRPGKRLNYHPTRFCDLPSGVYRVEKTYEVKDKKLSGLFQVYAVVLYSCADEKLYLKQYTSDDGNRFEVR